ncbi:MAG: tRNA (adenosine(37)-N6)-threonylcarbamoyltransferase complex ATPase subunit type 1 TsaE, partial [Pseudomonadota bacterium]|nr:tRNA (adenosine(37)-N6)-threonylcarbamoyltransferase complex ATPase subunit type 1 TsaE [Pseudomonadota bacterium]
MTTSKHIERFLPDAEATEALGRTLAITRPARAVVHLEGDLG